MCHLTNQDEGIFKDNLREILLERYVIIPSNILTNLLHFTAGTAKLSSHGKDAVSCLIYHATPLFYLRKFPITHLIWPSEEKSNCISHVS